MAHIKVVRLGEIDFYGQKATAFREMYADGIWKLVLLLNNERIVIMSY